MAKKQIVGNLVTEVSADNSKFKASLQEASKIANSTQFKIKSSFQKILPTTKQLEKGFASATGAVIAFTAAIGVSVKKFADFETDFTNVVTLLDEGSFKLTDFKTGVDNLKKGVLDLGKDTGESFASLNKGLFDTVSAGVKAEDSISVLTSAVKLAKAGATDTKISIDGLTSALNAYGLGAADSQKVAEKFYTAQKYGKCFAKGTEILMADGTSKKVEDIIVGDKIMGDDNSPRNILSLGRGREMMYRVTLRDNSSYIVNESHILSLKKNSYNHNGTSFTPKILNINIKDYINKSKDFKSRWLSYKSGIELEERVLYIDPYLLGLWLGDGHSASPRITTMDKEIVDYLIESSYNNKWNIKKYEQYNNKSSIYSLTKDRCCQGKGSFTELLNKYGLLNNKHIPEDFRINSRKNRLKLLAGLIDTDGSLINSKTNKRYEFSNKNKKIIDDVVWIARSCGFYAKVYKKNIKSETYYRVYISGNVYEIPCIIKRKKISKEEIYRKNVECQGFKVEKLDIDDYYGFEIDGNRLFLLNDFTVTHNTTIEELSNNFGKAGATANAFGVSLNELLAATAAATTGGIRTEAAFTGLNAILANVSKPTAEAKDEAKRLGIEFNSTALRAQGLTKFLDSISKSSGFTQTSIERLFGSIEAQKIAFALTGGSAETFKNILTELSNETQTATTFQNAYNRVMETTGVTIAKVARDFEAFQIEIGENAAPAVNDLVGEFIKLEEQTQGVSNSIKAVTAILQILVGTFKELLLGGEAIGEFLAKIGIAFDNAGKKMTAFKALTGGVGEFTVDVVKEFNKASDAIDNFGKKSANLKVGGSTKINLDIPNSTKIDWENLKNNINDTVDAANKVGNGLKDLNNGLDKDAAKKYANSITDLQYQLTLLGKTEREIAILNAERDLKGADPKQVKQAKDLAAQYYDQKEALDGIEEEQKKLIETADDVGSILTSNFRDAIFEADKFSDVLNNIGLQLLELTFQRSILDPLAGSISTGFSSLLGFADGGRPPMNKPSIVGERGAELFVPDTSGTIIPNEVLSSGVNTGTTIYADLRGASLEAVQRLEAYVQSINASLEKRSVAAVADANRRNPRLLRT